jgi:16S rRNA (cytosine1402-N4)-methyltransferase
MTMPGRSPSSGFEPSHEPVLVAEVVEWLRPRADGVYVDGTLGLGGHTRALIGAGAGRVIGIDRDADAIAEARRRLADAADRIVFVHDDYRRVADVLAAEGLTEVQGMVVDLGVSSMQLDEPARGFSFRQAGPLDMRMDRTRGLTLAERLADVTDTELADVIWQYGDERHSRRIARAIVAARDRGALADTGALAAVVRRAAGGKGWQRIDPATRTFQALRMWVNDEPGGVQGWLEAAPRCLAHGGRLAVIAFHSIEDRAVKQRFRALAAETDAFVVATRRPVTPRDEECARNPRARSARLRVLERVA